MSGIDDYTRFYWTVDQAGNLAVPVDGDYHDYPQISSGQSSSNRDPNVAGVFSGLGFNIYSYEPSLVPTQVMSYWWVEERSNALAVPGLFAYQYGDYTIDFWIKVNSATSDIQPIFGNSSGWMIYYQNGVLHQFQTGSIDVRCVAGLVGEFHHVEFNRSYGVNRIFIDGILRELTADAWNPIVNPSTYNFYIGCTSYSYRNVDLVVDEIRFSTGIGRHIENFTPETGHYTSDALTEIPSPTDGILQFSTQSELTLEVEEGGTELSPVDGRIRLSDFLSLQLTLPDEDTVPAIQTGRIRFEGLFEIQGGVYGLTVPPVDDGTIDLDMDSQLLVSIEEPTVIDDLDDSILTLIENAITLPASLETEPFMDLSGWTPPDFEFTFRNSLLLEMEFTFNNSLNEVLEVEFTFKNSLTEILEVEFNFRNNLLSYNEVEKEITLLNRLLTTTVVEGYDGFYFSKVHGV